MALRPETLPRNPDRLIETVLACEGKIDSTVRKSVSTGRAAAWWTVSAALAFQPLLGRLSDRLWRGPTCRRK